MRFTFVRLQVLSILLLGTAQFAQAQALYGTVVGSVVDQSGAIIPGADVSLTEASTSHKRTTVTNEVGNYSLPTVVPGRYVLEVAARGFKTYQRTGVEVVINVVTRVDVQLEVGEMGETVTVTSRAATIQTDKADVNTELSSSEVTELPMSGYRNYQVLMNLVPGATPAVYNNALIGSPGRALGTNISGQHDRSNHTRLDGASNMRASLPHQTLYVPPAEAIQTVNISTNSFDADQGFAGGAVISVTTKSGTNEFHGVAFEYHMNSALQAKYFFLPSNQGTPKNISNIFGGTFGGPIKRDKLFFFGSFEGLRERITYNTYQTVPTADQRAGNFSAYGTTLYDPLTGNADGSGRTPFQDRIIPVSRQSQITLKAQSLLPLPNLPGTTSNYFASASSVFDRENYDFKLNWDISSSTYLWGKYSAMHAYVHSTPALGEAGGTGLVSGGGTGTGKVLAQVMTIGGTHIFTSKFLLEATLAYSLDPLDMTGHDYGENIGLDFLGIPGTNGPTERYSGMPHFAVSNYSAFGQIDAWSPKFVDNSYWTQSTNFNWTKGSHQFRFGSDITHNSINQWHPETGGGPRGRFDFVGGVTALRGGPSPNQFNSWAAFLLGLPGTVGKSEQPEDTTPREWLTGFYFTDRWQASRNLTVSLGLRYEYLPLMSRANRGIERYDPDTNLVHIGGLGSEPRNVGITTSKTLFGPRLGLAYRFMAKTVVRAGYGLSVDPVGFGNLLLLEYPTVISGSWTSANTYQPYGKIENGIPPVPVPDLSSGTITAPTNVVVRTLEEGALKRGYVQSFNLVIERELPGGFLVSAGYVGARTVRQMVSRDINAGTPGTGTAGRPYYKAYGRTVATTMRTPAESASYDSLQARLDRRFAAGLSVRTSYTWSKSMNAADSSGGNVLWNGSSDYYRNRALAGHDRTHNLRVAWIWDLPFGRGNRWATEGVAAHVLGGWRISGIFSSYSGTPFTVTASATSLNAAGESQTADQIKPEVEKLGAIGTTTPFFDPLAFAAITTARFGNSGRNLLRGPGLVNVDATIARTFRLTEGLDLEFRTECYNVSNTPAFNNPSTNVSNMTVSNGVITNLGGFMTVTSARQRAGSLEGGERAFRFGLRLVF